MMNELYVYLLPLMAGIGLGLFFFGGLWLTTRQVLKMRHPAWLILLSFLGRTALTLAGFYLLAQGRWERLLAAIVGFFVARFVLLHWPTSNSQALAVKNESVLRTKPKDEEKWT
jgi:F1F0 ATPase subunit 2